MGMKHSSIPGHSSSVGLLIYKACFLAIITVLFLMTGLPAWGQAGLQDDRVMLQGFYWESYRHGHPDKFSNYGDKHWYAIVRDEAARIREGLFDLVWLPPPAYAGDLSAGYNPKELFRFDNSYGSFEEHRTMLEALLKAGIEPVADIVINHRDGSHGWTGFQNPTWGTWAITKDSLT